MYVINFVFGKQYFRTFRKKMLFSLKFVLYYYNVNHGPNAYGAIIDIEQRPIKKKKICNYKLPNIISILYYYKTRQDFWHFISLALNINTIKVF
jgi:hypothetical protein